jgi:UDP-glucose 4-epimerase
VRRLLEDGHWVTVIDDFSSGSRQNLPIGNLHLGIHNMSINGPVDDLFNGIDVVFHLAALTRPRMSVQSPLPFHTVNVDGTLRVLLHSRASRVKRVVFASSSAVYGNQSIHPCPEYLAPRPMTPYALHKVIGEMYCGQFTDLYDLETISLRYFNTYGKRSNPNGEYAAVIPKFIKLIKEDRIPTIYGSGRQTRDFVHVSDVVEATVLAAESDIWNCHINIGSGDDISINDLFLLIRHLAGKDMEAIHGPPKIEPEKTLADIGRAKVMMGWEPKVSLEEGLEELIWT